MGWAILTAYVIGYAIAFVVIFRLAAADDLVGVHTETTPTGRVGSIAMLGMLAFVTAFLWPLLAFVLVVYRFAVAPLEKGREQ